MSIPHAVDCACTTCDPPRRAPAPAIPPDTPAGCAYCGRVTRYDEQLIHRRVRDGRRVRVCPPCDTMNPERSVR